MAITNLVGYGVHNFLDGLIIASAYVVSIPLGVTTLFAVLFHVVPQEVGDFGVSLYAGISRKKALLLNFASAALALVGGVVVLLLVTQRESLEKFFLLLPVADSSISQALI